jgi:CTP:molybdopterin cytidylyltransferase MocA
MRPEAVTGVVLAAGQGRRFGGFKALAPVGGRSMLARAVSALREAGVARILVVANPGWSLPDDVGGVEILVNDGWAEGMGSSLRLALSCSAVTQADAVALLLADTPLVTAECVRRVVAAGSGPDTLVQATYAGRRAHPVLIGREHLAGVREVAHADAGARAYLGAQRERLELVECGDVGDPVDIDTRADLERLEALQRLRQLALSLPETTERLSHGEPT